MRDERLYLTDILECIQKIESYTVDGKNAFLNTPMMQDAVIRNLEIIGEATKQISLELRQANSNVRWQQIAGLRDVLIHIYSNPKSVIRKPRGVWGLRPQGGGSAPSTPFSQIIWDCYI